MSGRVKGALFEILVKKLLEKNDYEPCQADNEQVDNQGRVRGRGEWHQIDALGRWRYTLPFVYPIRLLCEAKCWDDPVGLPVIRNFVGVIKDISENYFVEDSRDINRRMLSKRYTDCGAVFSVNGFTKPAQRYAYAQGIFLVSYENNPIVGEFIKIIEDMSVLIRLGRQERTREFQKWFERSWRQYSPRIGNRFVTRAREFLDKLERLKERFTGVRTSVVGIASGVYPLHILSYQELPSDLFRESDEVFFRVTYHRIPRGGHYFEIHPSDFPDLRYYFSVPEVILSKYRDSMRQFKKEFLKWIDLPVTIREMRRILRFKLDMEWLRSVE